MPTIAEGLWKVEGTLAPEESNYLWAYNGEMVQSGSGHCIDLAYQHGMLSQYLIPFFVLLDDLYRPLTAPVAYPWLDFSSRYEKLSSRQLADETADPDRRDALEQIVANLDLIAQGLPPDPPTGKSAPPREAPTTPAPPRKKKFPWRLF